MCLRRLVITVKVGGALFAPVGAFVSAFTYFVVRNDVADVAYRPLQPVPFSHKLHAGDLQVHCQYCHAGVESSAHSPVPTTQTCMNCHTVVKGESPQLKLVRDSYESGMPIEWVRI